MATQKTTETNADVSDFIDTAVATDQRRNDALTLLDWMQKVSGYPARMWGSGIIGFGTYHYKYASGHEGDAPLIGFSPRKAAFSLYVFSGLPEHEPLLNDLGKFKRGKACLYVNALSDINMDKLEVIVQETIRFLRKTYGTS